MKTSQLIITLAACQFITGNCLALTPFSDKFNAKTLNKSRWTLKNHGKGRLAPGNGRVNFTVAAKPTGDDFSTIDLKNNRPGYNESWEIILDVANTANLGSKAGVGFQIYNAADPRDVAALEFYGKSGFVAITITDGKDKPADDLMRNPGVRKGSIRISFDKSTKLVSFWYDATGSANGFQWKRIGTFSPTGKGGTRRGNWKMNPSTGRFGIQLFGFGEGRVIPGGKVSLDNFKLKAVR